MGEPWTAEQLTALRRSQRYHGGDLGLISEEVGRSRLDVNRALDALLGRTPAEAGEALALADRTGPDRTGPDMRGRLKSFVKALFDGRA